jgi:Flp pilus assembly protein TadG
MDIKNRVSDDRGTALPFLVIAMVPLGILTAAFMDAARLYVTRAQMQVAADAGALGGASGFIDGDADGDSVEARVLHYVEANAIGQVPAIVDTLTVDLDAGTVSLVLRHRTGSLLLAPGGMTMRARATARSRLAGPGEVGRPIPNGNAYGWYNKDETQKDETQGGGTDSAVVKLGS